MSVHKGQKIARPAYKQRWTLAEGELARTEATLADITKMSQRNYTAMHEANLATAFYRKWLSRTTIIALLEAIVIFGLLIK